MTIDSSDFIAQGTDSPASWTRETQYYVLTRQQVGGRLLLRKSLKPQYLNDNQLRETLRKEYEIGTIIGMDTDYVVNYYQMVDAPDECFLTMDFVEGETLAELALTDPDYLGSTHNFERILLQLLEGLRVIHHNQVVHLDLKPSNIMITHVSRDIRIIDLGFCYADSYHSSMGKTDYFASPEQLDDSCNVDARSDIYSFGRLLQWLVRELDTYCQWRNNTVFKKLISRCLCQQKSDRWQNVDEMISYIEKSRENKKWIYKIACTISLICSLSLIYYLFQLPTTGYDAHILYGDYSLFDRSCQAIGKIKDDSKDPYWQGNLYISSKVKHWGITFKVTGVSDYAFCKDSSFATINLPASLLRIGTCSFRECPRLIAVNIPDQVTEIGDAAFWGDSCLSELKLSSNITSIPDGCFHLCAFNSLTIPEGVKEIDLDAFAVCRNLQEVSLPQSLRFLGRGAFWRCESLEKITLPKNLATIGEYTFMGCTKLRQIENLAVDPQPVMSLFDHPISDLRLLVPLESVDKYQQAPEWKRLTIEPLSSL